MAASDKYRDMLADLAAELTDKDATDLAFEVVGGRGGRHNITSARGLITELERTEYISQNNVDNLYKLLKKRGFNAAANVLEGYKKSPNIIDHPGPGISPKDKKVDKKHLTNLAKRLGRNWRDVGRHLEKITDEDLETLSDNNPGNQLQAVHEMFRQWTKSNGEKATYEKLGEALEAGGRTDLQEETLKYAEEN